MAGLALWIPLRLGWSSYGVQGKAPMEVASMKARGGAQRERRGYRLPQTENVSENVRELSKLFPSDICISQPYMHFERRL